SCAQVVFPDALGRDICGDGVDNDCDGAADAQDSQLCASVPAGDVCGLAYQADLSGLGVFSGSLEGYRDDVELGCGDGGGAVERFYRVTLNERRVLRLEVRAAGGGEGYVGISRVDDCQSSSLSGGVECAGSFFTRELAPGTYTFAVFGQPGRTFTLLASSVLPGDDAGTSCQPGDLDADGATLCTSDCMEGNVAVHAGAAEQCDNLDNDCNGVIDDGIPGQPCAVAGALGVCAQGMLGCTQGAFVCHAPKPGQQQELCNDGRDNDCDGMSDDQGTPGVDCALLTGDRCDDALPIGDGFFDGSLSGAGHHGNGCYGGIQGDAEERYHVFQVPAPGFYYLQVRATGQGPFPPFAAGIFSGPCALDMQGSGCSGSGGNVVYYYLDKPGPHYVMVESDDAFDYRIGLASTDAAGACSLPDGDGDGFDLCNYDCDDQSAAVHPGATEVCNGRDDDCNGVTDEGC
ncbi:MAG TPA: putative metal-binding motif-containing protein, partial [Polyangiales bacterium]